MIKIIAPGKIKDKHLKALIDDYILKISRYHKIEIIEVKDEAIVLNDTEEHIKAKEANAILKNIKDGDYVVILDLKGKMIDSIEFSKMIDKVFTYSPNLCFVIGGSLGLDDRLRKRANYSLKLSDMTFLHQMTRLILVEQVYRSFKILNNENYHK